LGLASLLARAPDADRSQIHKSFFFFRRPTAFANGSVCQSVSTRRFALLVRLYAALDELNLAAPPADRGSSRRQKNCRHPLRLDTFETTDKYRAHGQNAQRSYGPGGSLLSRSSPRRKTGEFTPIWRSESARIIPQRRSRFRRCTTKRTAIGIG
jgi:hypothetical protein